MPAGHELIPTLREAVAAVEALFADARRAVADRVTIDGRPVSRILDREQRATHGLAWLATYVEAIRQLAAYAQRLVEADNFGEIEELLVRIGAGEYLAQILGGIPMSQGEIVRLSDLGLTPAAVAARVTPAVEHLIATGNTADHRARLVNADPRISSRPRSAPAALTRRSRRSARRCASSPTICVVPHAQEWHLRNEYIPLEVIEQMSELGVFSLTIPEDYGGMGLGKESMCVVSEELSRGYIGVGSLGTRSEIAAELILGSGTAEQKRKWLPKIASGEVLPTAVFTEPNTGSDLATLKTRAVREGEAYKVYGNKTWITHPVRADLMTLLVRTNPGESGYRGLSMLLAEKPRGGDGDPFPVSGMSGTEIEVLGYRGMKEYEIAFDGFAVKADNLLGGVEGQGFKQLMATFESARIQTAARAIGVAQAAMEQGLSYATTRVQFGEPIAKFPARFRQARHDGRRDHDRAPAHLPCGAAKGFRAALRPRSRHGETAGGARRLGGGRQCGAGPRRQRLCGRVPRLAHSLRRAHPQYFRGRRRDSGAGDRAAPAGWDELSTASAVEFLSSFVDCRGYGLDGCFQTRQFVKDDVPNNAVGKATVFVPQNIAYPAHTWPRNCSGLRFVRSFGIARLASDMISIAR